MLVNRDRSFPLQPASKEDRRVSIKVDLSTFVIKIEQRNHTAWIKKKQFWQTIIKSEQSLYVGSN